MRHWILALGLLLGLSACGTYVRIEEPADEPDNEGSNSNNDDANTSNSNNTNNDGVNNDSNDNNPGSLGEDEIEPRHASWETLLVEFSSSAQGGQASGFDYLALSESDLGKSVLDNYIASLQSSAPLDFDSANERLSFWLNTYNALTVREIIEVFDEDVDYLMSTDNFSIFTAPVFSMDGYDFSLDEIEHGILRNDLERFDSLGQDKLDYMTQHYNAVWEGDSVDPKIHVALNCGARSCPDLVLSQPFAFSAGIVDGQLDARARQFCDDPNKGASAAGISSLFDWFGDDFGGASGIEAFLMTYRADGTSGVNTSLFLNYDWRINHIDK